MIPQRAFDKRAPVTLTITVLEIEAVIYKIATHKAA